MLRPPRMVNRPILDAFGVWRVVFVGALLLILTLWAFFWMKSQGASDPLARTAAVNALVIGQVFYLLNSRFKIDSSLSPMAHLGNRYLPMGIGAVIVLQLLLHVRAAAAVGVRDRGDAARRLAVAVPWRLDFLPRRRDREGDHPRDAFA